MHGRERDGDRNPRMPKRINPESHRSVPVQFFGESTAERNGRPQNGGLYGSAMFVLLSP